MTAAAEPAGTRRGAGGGERGGRRGEARGSPGPPGARLERPSGGAGGGPGGATAAGPPRPGHAARPVPVALLRGGPAEPAGSAEAEGVPGGGPSGEEGQSRGALGLLEGRGET